MNISVSHKSGTRFQKKTIKTIDMITAKAARRMVLMTRNAHSIGENLLGQNMNNLGKVNDGYSIQYDRWKKRYNSINYDGGTVNLHSSGRFHRNLRIRKGRRKGVSSYGVGSSLPPAPIYPGTSDIRHTYKEIFKDFETFRLSNSNRRILIDILRDCRRTVIQSILIRS